MLPFVYESVIVGWRALKMLRNKNGVAPVQE